MTDDEILDQWHRAELAHAKAADGDMLEAFIKKAAAEDAAIARFGLGPHRQAYEAAFPWRRVRSREQADGNAGHRRDRSRLPGAVGTPSDGGRCDGEPVAQSHVIEIVFPGDTIETLLGPVNTIVGAGAPRSQWVNHDTRCAAVLRRRASMEHGQRNEIVGATDQALTLRMDGREAATPWSTVTGVSAGRARLDRLSEQWVLVLAIEAEVEGRERLFIVGEVEPAWLPLTATLHQALPDIAPFEVWGAQLVTASEPMELYQRSISPS